MLRASALCFDAGGKRLIDGIDIDIRPGRRTVVMGANGAGKSLLLRLLHGLIRPTAGEVLWQGRAPRPRRPARAGDGIPAPVLLRRSVLANLRFALAVRGLSGPERAAREAEAMERSRLGNLANRPARVLSGGEQQRLAVVRALACRPRVLFLDEPTASLDPGSTHAIERLVGEAHESGVAIVLVTHDIGQARRPRRRPGLFACRPDGGNRARFECAGCASLGRGPRLARGPALSRTPHRAAG